jgi:hypothetical protein
VAIANDIVVLQVPYGNPGSVGEPLGIWTGKATVVGDASGGDIETRFVPQNPTTTPTLDDQREQYVWFIDAAGVLADGVLGNVGARIQPHWARSNAALNPPVDYAVVVPTLTDGLILAAAVPLIRPEWQRVPIFWTPENIASGNSVLVHLQAQTNTLAVNYTFSAHGRYYDRQILSNRAFGRLISPVAMSQFEG